MSIYFSLGLIKNVKATGEASPSKVNIQLGSLLASWIRILPTKINADSDPALFVRVADPH